MPRAVRTAVEVAGGELGAIRIDSGDLPVLARQVRDLLDELGATKTRIVLTGDLDEYSIAALGAVPVDGYGVGTSLVTGSGAPTAALVYKLVARASASEAGVMEPVAKRSVGKPGRGGRKWAVRHRDQQGTALSERVSLLPPEPGPLDRELLVPLVRDGEVVSRPGAEEARAQHRAALAELPPYALQLSRGYPAIPTVFDPNGDEVLGPGPGSVRAPVRGSADREGRVIDAPGSTRARSERQARLSSAGQVLGVSPWRRSLASLRHRTSRAAALAEKVLRLAWRIRVMRSVPTPSGYQILRAGQILHVNRLLGLGGRSAVRM